MLLIERDLSPPDRIVGELLQPGGCAALRALGMGDCLDDIDAVGVEGYYVCVSHNPEGGVSSAHDRLDDLGRSSLP